MAKTYAAIKRDREAEEQARSQERLSKIENPQQYVKALEEDAKKQRAAAKRSGYTQPSKIGWMEFLQWRRWDQRDVDQLPEDQVLLDFGIYSLKLRYAIPLV